MSEMGGEGCNIPCRVLYGVSPTRFNGDSIATPVEAAGTAASTGAAAEAGGLAG
jgi:hypothetical protein